MHSKNIALFVSDAHIKSDAEAEVFNAFLRNARGRAEHIFLLGDIFELWLGYAKFETTYQRAVLDELSRLEDEGAAVHYIEGNRDFFVAESKCSRIFSEYIKTDGEFRVDDVRVALTHGDLINRDDRLYRFWRRVAKSAPSRTAFAAMPSGLGYGAARRLERILKPLNPKYKNYFPEKHCLDYARRKFAEGFKIVVIGHFHIEKEYELAGGRLFVLPMWRETRRYLAMSADKSFKFETFQG